MAEKTFSWTPLSSPYEVFPKTKKFGNKIYRQSIVNPGFIRNTSQTRAGRDCAQIRREGWAARVVRFDTPKGFIYLVYERRARPVYAYASSTGKRTKVRG